ncbi:MAG: hydroxymethylglutaryl-CoA lyase [Bacteroidetes bacterium]|nr:hydroxymethylglutaryl-CoA lyase [Bacteroidota bacterium]
MEVKIIECPRDAMQGLKHFIDTSKKIKYLNSLLEVGFDTLDCGSFVSPKLIPQMADTALVLKKLNHSSTKLSVIVANMRGAIDASEFENVTYLGFPFSVSETFQLKNTNSTMRDSLGTVRNIINRCAMKNKKFIAYISMCFGNPYGDLWNEDIVLQWIKKLQDEGANYFSLSDTAGMSNPATISTVIKTIREEFPKLNFGCHFHSHDYNWQEKLQAAIDSGCLRFDGALKGFGGCPMASDNLVGNMPTELMVDFIEKKGIKTGLNISKLNDSIKMANEIFN